MCMSTVMNTVVCPQAESSLRSELEPVGIIVKSQTFKTTEDPIEAVKNLLVSR